MTTLRFILPVVVTVILWVLNRKMPGLALWSVAKASAELSTWKHTLVLGNLGNESLEPSNFHGAVRVSVGMNRRIANWGVLKTYPDEFQPVFTANESELEFEPTLLNRGDGVAFFIETDTSQPLTISGRLKGQSMVNGWLDNAARIHTIWITIAGVMFVIALFWLGLQPSDWSFSLLLTSLGIYVVMQFTSPYKVALRLSKKLGVSPGRYGLL